MIKIKSPCSTHSCRNRGFFHFNAASFRRMKKRTSYFNNILNRYLYPAFSKNFAEVQRIIEKLSGTHHGKEIRLKTSDSLAPPHIFSKLLNFYPTIWVFKGCKKHEYELNDTNKNAHSLGRIEYSKSKTSYLQVLSIIWCGWFDPKYF